MFKRFLVLAFVACASHVVPAHAQECDARCAAYIRGVIRQWDEAVRVTQARTWYGAVIASQPVTRCVVHRESRGDVYAENAVSTASGLVQFLDGTWDNVARARGRPDLLGHASWAPWYEQLASFWWLYEREGLAAWGGHCP